MKFETIETFFMHGEQVQAKIKPKAGNAMISTAIIVGIVYLVICAALTLLIFIDYVALFLFFVGLFMFSCIITMLVLFSGLKKTIYVVTDKFLYVPISSRLIICPINDLTIINESKIYIKSRKIDNIVIKCSSRRIVSVGVMGKLQSAPLGLAHLTSQAILSYGKICLQAIENPKSVILLLKNQNNNGVSSVF